MRQHSGLLGCRWPSLGSDGEGRDAVYDGDTFTLRTDHIDHIDHHLDHIDIQTVYRRSCICRSEMFAV